MKKVLLIGDSPSIPTGFSNVMLNIFKGLTDTYEIHQLAINYYGDPHTVPWKLYPASVGGDIWGFNRLKNILDVVKPDLIFILNDAWVISNYLNIIKKNTQTTPKIVVYYPVDSMGFDEDWFKDYDIVTQPIVYTKFGFEVTKACCGIEPKIIPHGTDLNTFYQIELPDEEIKRSLYPDKPEFYDNSFIALNVSRNQPRKRIDITIEGFYLFSDGLPENVKLYLHMGKRDSGWDIIKLVKRYGMDSRLIITGNTDKIQTVPADKLNLIYNATDVGINTSIGEGWSLPNTEHACCGKPQIVPNHSACKELFEGYGALISLRASQVNHDTNTVSFIPDPISLAQNLRTLYENKELRKTLGNKGQLKFTSPEYLWGNISNKFKEVFEECLQ